MCIRGSRGISGVMTWAGMGLAVAGSALLVLGHLKNDYIVEFAGESPAGATGIIYI